VSEILDRYASAEASCEALVRDMWLTIGRRDLLKTVAEELKLPPYADDPTQDGLEPEKA